jgi:linoleoyl-CoA desaturase
MKFSIQKSAMFIDLKKMVDNYFKENNISETGDWRLYVKTFFWVGLYLWSYLSLTISPPQTTWEFISLCIIHGLSWAGIGFNVVHDAAHGSYSKNPILNIVISHFFDLLGVSNYMWRSKHNIAHHTYVSIEDEDDDIETLGAMRLTPNQEWKWYHRFQAFYATPLYSLLYIIWISKKDFEKYRNRIVGNTNIPEMNRIDKFLFWFFKSLYVVIYFVIPILVWGWVAFIGWLIAAGTCGVTISLVFQLAHIVRKAQFPVVIDDKVESSFDLHQIRTTVDFATNNWLVSWLVGGLNFQVIHHLFPKISHVHYKAIQKIAMVKFKEYGIEYKQYETLAGAIFNGHFGHLWDMSKKPIKS